MKSIRLILLLVLLTLPVCGYGSDISSGGSGVTIGVDVQAYSSILDDVSVVTPIANGIFGYNNAGVFGLYTNHSHDDSAAQFYSATASKGTRKFVQSSISDGILLNDTPVVTGNATFTTRSLGAGTYYKAFENNAVIDGSAHVHLTANQMRDANCQVSSYGQAAEDINIGLPTAAFGLSCLFTVATAQSNHWGVLASTNDKIYLIAAAGTVVGGTDADAAVMVAAQLGQSFACWSFNSGNATYDWMCKAISIGTSTFEAHAAW